MMEIIRQVTARTNRERYILKRDEYDLMMQISDNIQSDGIFCAIRAVSGKRKHCDFDVVKDIDENVVLLKVLNAKRNCERCIQQWLNEESEG